MIHCPWRPAAPLRVELTGISYCDGSYRIRRRNSKLSVFEFVTHGKGTLKIGDQTHHLSTSSPKAVTTSTRRICAIPGSRSGSTSPVLSPLLYSTLMDSVASTTSPMSTSNSAFARATKLAAATPPKLNRSSPSHSTRSSFKSPPNFVPARSQPPGKARSCVTSLTDAFKRRPA